MRYFLEIAYNGSRYHGWQLQKNAITVQGEINRVLSTILRENIEVVGSGRTDAGVHATQQFAHFDWQISLNEQTYLHKFNSMLPADISLKSIKRVVDSAHARFNAEIRSYEYKISRHKDPFFNHLHYRFAHTLNVSAMNKAALCLLDTHDFESFSKVHTEVNNFLCTIHRAEWQEHNENLIFYVSANRFLRGMVRALVGTLLEVGMGNMSLEEFKEVIESKNRNNAGRSVPARGLFLCEVTYPSAIFIEE